MSFKKYLPQGLFGRTFLIVIVPVLLLQILVSIVFFDRHWSKMTARLAFAVTGEISAIAAQLDAHHNDDDRVQQIKSIANTHLNLNVYFNPNAQTLPTQSPETFFGWGIDRDLSRSLSNDMLFPFLIVPSPETKTILVHVQLSAGILTVTIPQGRLFSSSSYIFILWMVGISILLFTIAMIFMRNQIRPIYRLGLIAERLGRGIPVGTIKPTGAREVRQATEAFVNMQDRLNQFLNQRATMLAGVSHDLKTPLTRMKLQLEMMPDSPDSASLSQDIHDMEDMIEGYISFIRGDGGEAMQRVNIHDVLDKMMDNAARLSLEIHDNRATTDAMTTWIKPVSLARALDNIIGNASRYATALTLDMTCNDDTITIVIADNGEGIPDDKLTDVMKPFVRVENSRNSKTGGAGLGLSIANDIIASHGGTLTLSNAQNGLQATIILPF
jgi:two-component system osmolarity sensor histidine kinase EnvZ